MGGGSFVQEGSLVGVCTGVCIQMNGLADVSCCWDGGQNICIGHDISIVQLSGDRFRKAFIYGVGVLGTVGLPVMRGGFLYSQQGTIYSSVFLLYNLGW
jgi:hypothetical protein